jgi:hypothetical protein
MPPSPKPHTDRQKPHLKTLSTAEQRAKARHATVRAAHSSVKQTAHEYKLAR